MSEANKVVSRDARLVRPWPFSLSVNNTSTSSGTDFFIYSKLKVIDSTREVNLLMEYVYGSYKVPSISGCVLLS